MDFMRQGPWGNNKGADLRADAGRGNGEHFLFLYSSTEGTVICRTQAVACADGPSFYEEEDGEIQKTPPPHSPCGYARYGIW